MGGTREQGQAAPLMAAIVVLIGLLGVLTVRVAGAAVDRARARTAADAAALAGAADGRSAAVALAAANGGTLVAFAAEPGGAVTVVVRVGPAQATARARADTAAVGEPSPALAAALARAGARLGHRVEVVAVGPGGASVQVAPDAVADIDAIGPDIGLCRPTPKAHPDLVSRCAAGG